MRLTTTPAAVFVPYQVYAKSGRRSQSCYMQGLVQSGARSFSEEAVHGSHACEAEEQQPYRAWE